MRGKWAWTDSAIRSSVTFDSKESLYDYLETAEGKRDHEDYDMSSIATFEMYDLTPDSGRLPGSN